MKDVLKGNWNEMRAWMKQCWDRLTDTDLDEINGNHDVLVSKLQEKYSFDTPSAERQVKQRLAELDRENRTLVRN